jgi:hypothetical protein
MNTKWTLQVDGHDSQACEYLTCYLSISLVILAANNVGRRPPLKMSSYMIVYGGGWV